MVTFFGETPWIGERSGSYAGDLDASGKCANWRSNVRRQLRKPAIEGVMLKLSTGVTLQGINISHLGKRKIIFKMPFLGDMLVPWRVYFCFRFLRNRKVFFKILWKKHPCERLGTEAGSAVTGAMYAGGFMARAL